MIFIEYQPDRGWSSSDISLRLKFKYHSHTFALLKASFEKASQNIGAISAGVFLKNFMHDCCSFFITFHENHKMLKRKVMENKSANPEITMLQGKRFQNNVITWHPAAQFATTSSLRAYLNSWLLKYSIERINIEMRYDWYAYMH